MPQRYELHIKRKQVYFINPVMNYLDIKDGKPKYIMEYNKEKIIKIFECLSKVDLSNLSQYVGSGNDTIKFAVRVVFTNNNSLECIIPAKELPEDLRLLYETIIK